MSDKGTVSRRSILKAGVVAAGAIGCQRAWCAEVVDATPWIQKVGDHEYYLIPFDELSRERPWGKIKPTLSSQQAAKELASQPITDVFMFSHGWQGDMDAAYLQYERWVTAMAACTADIAKMQQVRPGFRPLLIGVHWPSLPFGDEELRDAASAIAVVDSRIDKYAKRIGDTPASRAALHTILAASEAEQPDRLSPQLIHAFRTLQGNARHSLRSVGRWQGVEDEGFDPQRLYAEMQAVPSFDAQTNGFAGNLILELLRATSFWKMKDRARQFGESGGHHLLASLQAAVPRDRTVRFHLMGHSFGCIVMSATLAGPPGATSSVRPVDSLSLVQGALSLWGYCSSIPAQPRTAGYFRPILERRLVRGAIITTQSQHDTAVGRYYPLAAGVARQVAYAREDQPVLPKYGGVGTYGINGLGCDPQAVEILAPNADYRFLPGKIYNIECSRVIATMADKFSGAHSDICHPEVAHAIWEAAMVKSR